MVEVDWAKTLHRMDAMEDYLTRMIRTVGGFKDYGVRMSNHSVAIDAEKARQGLVGLRKVVIKTKGIALYKSGGVQIPINTHPHLTLLKGGGNAKTVK